MRNNAEIVREFIDEVLNKNRIDAAGDYFWDDMVELAPFPGQGPGLAGLQDVLRQLRVAFPDIHWTVEEQLVDGDRVLTRFVWKGTHRGIFLGVPATNLPASVWGMVIDRLHEGKVKETRIIMDMLGLMMQLGVVGP
ncbi:ester cyclase [Lacipirellula sp.]|uniref:ester cyclase n=1 Tax=Lacipirellula sp. TaxID=2691419 RepID=UPI003D14A4E4